jgi:hypothetical protein
VLTIDDLGHVVGAGHGADNDIASLAAIRPPFRLILLAAKTTAARAAVAPLDEQRHTIDKLHDSRQKTLSLPNTFSL